MAADPIHQFEIHKLAVLGHVGGHEIAITNSDIQGSRKTLVADSFIPAMMAAIYLLILLYFKSIGGYKPLSIDEGSGPPAPPSDPNKPA